MRTDGATARLKRLAGRLILAAWALGGACGFLSWAVSWAGSPGAWLPVVLAALDTAAVLLAFIWEWPPWR